MATKKSKADSRSVHTDALATLGTIHKRTEFRDAIHLAVEAVVAAKDLKPGAHIGFNSKGLASDRAQKKLGIVDPFLTAPVLKGQRFWLVVYPRAITSLRHVWSHPDFPEAEIPMDSPKPVAERATPEELQRIHSVDWIKRFAESVERPYEALMDGARGYLKYGAWMNGGAEFEGTFKQEFWDHYEIVTGESVTNRNRGSFFNCSCG
ncbi:hypothetical protein [Achromobacter phage Motura]|uniref:Uncharacterized protein n=1 Tax=Achromobacter phage Motura TaxID=2591403 RepID=A0A514CSU5_9CAUD|nr:hypothetical protein H1O15_gp253 [Achromobacter phage Motura]QDH83535.1 hypothetical protein [Achromobacter phage Motura]